MTGAGRARRAGGLAAALLIAAALPPPALGADGEAQVLPGGSLAAMAIDLDGDGANEVLRLADRDRPGMDLEAWSVRQGTWSSIGSTVVASHPGPDGALDPSGEIAAILRWRLEGRDHALLATAAMLQVPNVPSAVCCVELADVVVANGILMLAPLQTPGLSADFIAAVDMDGDGTDELVTQATAYEDMNDAGTFRVEVHRWDGLRFRRIHSEERDDPGFGVIPGDGDGLRGSELYLAPSATGALERLVLADGIVASETAAADLGQPYESWILGAANGRILIQQPQGIRLMAWPRGEPPTEVGRFRSMAYPRVDIVGSGDDAIFVVYEGFDYFGSPDPQLMLLDLDFNEIGALPVSDRMAPLWEAARAISDRGYGVGRSLFPFVGALPDAGPRDSWPYLANGVRIDVDDVGGFTTADANPFIGVTPIGRAGPDGEWLALGQSIYGYYGPFGASDSAVYLFPFDLSFPSAGALAMVPADRALAPMDEPIATFQADGAATVEVDGETRLAASYDGFQVVIDAPVGSLVTHDDGRAPIELEVGDGPLVIEVRAPRGPKNRNREFTHIFFLTTPDGRAQVLTWEGTFLGEPPEVSADAETEAFALRARISGRASDGASVTVDGVPADVHAGGAYSVEVDAPIWPTDVVVVARDPIGNEVTQRLQIVGFLDYRGLPWAAIIGLATVAAGAFLFVRTPRRREVDAPTWGDARLEEIDGDSV